MTIQVLSTIDNLAIDSLSKASLASKILCRASGSTLIDGYTSGYGLALGTSSSAPPAFTMMDTYVVQGRINHSYTSGAVDYVLPLQGSYADNSPSIYFEAFTTKMSGDALADVNMYMVPEAGSADTSANYSQNGFNQSGTSVVTLIANTATSGGIPLGTVYSGTATSTVRQTLTVGRGFIKSGGQRIFSLQSTNSNATIFGVKNMVCKWSNTADVVSGVMIRVPANVNLVFNIYQRYVA